MKKSFIPIEEEISFVKNNFTQYLKDKLEVVEVQVGPVLSKVGDGIGDNLQGLKIQFQLRFCRFLMKPMKWCIHLLSGKRHTLARFGFAEEKVPCSHEGSSPG